MNMKSVNELALNLIFDQRVRLSRSLANNKPLFIKVKHQTPASAQADHVLQKMKEERNNPKAQQILLEHVIRASRMALRQKATADRKAKSAASATPTTPGGGSSCPPPVVKIEPVETPVPTSTE